jgi:hypothetical protein
MDYGRLKVCLLNAHHHHQRRTARTSTCPLVKPAYLDAIPLSHTNLLVCRHHHGAYVYILRSLGKIYNRLKYILLSVQIVLLQWGGSQAKCLFANGRGESVGEHAR